ncbi:MAG: hypothetical protein LBR26_09905 [Prevotella sp.]|jgi:hypothetical protein|nr:hypothetical protein [Prevotella sp.]
MATLKTIAVTGITAGVAVTAVSDQGWCTVAGGSFVGNGNFTIQCGAYSSTDSDRSANVTVTSSDGATAAIVTVSQLRQSVILLTPNAVTFDAAGNVLT